jgi:hypothetical protein
MNLKKHMLYQGRFIRHIALVTAICFLSLTRCNILNSDYKDKIVSTTHLYHYQNDNFENYKDFREKIIDSVRLYAEELFLTSYTMLNGGEWDVDSTLIFNRDGSRFITSINRTNTLTSNYTDGLHALYGYKINGTWYILMGGHTVLPREYYTKQIDEPLTAEQLGFLAKKQVLRTYIERNSNSNRVNEKAFDNLVFYPVTYVKGHTIPPIVASRNHDSILIHKYYKQRFNYSSKFKKEYYDSLRLVQPEPISKVDESKSIKFFDSKEWKNRRDILNNYD